MVVILHYANCKQVTAIYTMKLQSSILDTFEHTVVSYMIFLIKIRRYSRNLVYSLKTVNTMIALFYKQVCVSVFRNSNYINIFGTNVQITTK